MDEWMGGSYTDNASTLHWVMSTGYLRLEICTSVDEWGRRDASVGCC